MTVRPARIEDAPAIARIYNEGIEERIATFEADPRTADDIARALADRGERYPTVVLERDGGVVAVAWAGQYRPRACYDGIGEFSVYTDREARDTGAGREVMEGLIAECEKRGFWKLVSRIFPENTASRALCRRLGFREVGIYRRHGKLDGEWRDCVIVELLLGEAVTEPRPEDYSEHMLGLHGEMWEGVEPQEYVRQERAEWPT
jgi:phosphinothricin acetyltransferase